MNVVDFASFHSCSTLLVLLNSYQHGLSCAFFRALGVCNECIGVRIHDSSFWLCHSWESWKTSTLPLMEVICIPPSPSKCRRGSQAKALEMAGNEEISYLRLHWMKNGCELRREARESG
jgi:hypothetical protein